MRVLLTVLRTRTGAARAKVSAQLVELALDPHGAIAFHPVARGGIAARLRRARVVEISADGFRIEGLEPCGARLHWQEWWCRPEAPDA